MMIRNKDDDRPVLPDLHNDEEEFECRICREEGDAFRPLLHPCACSGSIKWCHESCLLDWLKASGRRDVCETCGKSLIFNPLYRANAPEVLSPLEFTYLMLKRLVRRSPALFRWFAVCFTWIYLVPVFSSAMLAFLRTGNWGGEYFYHGMNSLGPGALLRLILVPFTVWEQGAWVLFAGFCVMFLLVTVVDFVRQYEAGVFALEVEQLRQQQRLGGGNRAPAPAAAAMPVPAPAQQQQQQANDEVEHVMDAPWLLVENNDPAIMAAALEEELHFDEEDGDQDGLEDWVGLRGPLCRMVNHALFVCLFVALFIAAFHSIPETAGRNLLRLLRVPDLTATTAARQYASTYEGPLALFHAANKCYEEDKALALDRLNKAMLEVLAVVLGTLGEMLALFAGNLALGFACRHLLPASLLPGWLSLLRISCSICRIQKVLCLFAFKMLVFPILLGVLIERAARPALQVSHEDRLFFAADKPHLALLILWFAGITHTLLVSVNVILVRDILHPQVLDGVIRTRDPHANQFLPMLLEPWFHQLKRTLVTCFIYTAIVLLFIALPVWILESSSHLPLSSLRVHLFFAGLEIPICLVLFHIWMLTELECNKPKMVAFQERFFAFWCSVLGLTEYLLPIAVNQEEYADARRHVLAQAAQLHWLDSTPRISLSLLRARVVPRFVHLRLLVLIAIAWFTWLAGCAVLLLVPFQLGLFVGYCFPIPSSSTWLTTDARLFFVGWYVMETCLRFLANHGQALVVRWNHVRAVQAVFFLASAFFFLYSPLLCGLFSVLMVGSSDANFPIAHYQQDLGEAELLLGFLSDLARSQPLDRMWFAGLPILAAFLLTSAARRIWQAWLQMRIDLVLSACFLAQVQFVLFQIGGIATGLALWRHGSSMSLSPLYFVRLCMLVTLGIAMGGMFISSNWDAIKTGCQHVHQSLKDEKYLLGKRLINFQS